MLDLPDRMRHKERHEHARRQLSRIGRPRKVLVVCSGNMCRSPYLAAVLARDLPGLRIASAGFVGFNRRAAAHSVAVAARRGIDLSGFRSSSLEPRRARTADLVIVMEPKQADYLARYCGVSRSRIIVAGDLDFSPASARAIADPLRQSIEVFETCFARLDRCAKVVNEILRAGAEPPAIQAPPAVSRVPIGKWPATDQHLQPVP